MKEDSGQKDVLGRRILREIKECPETGEMHEFLEVEWDGEHRLIVDGWGDMYVSMPAKVWGYTLEELQAVPKKWPGDAEWSALPLDVQDRWRPVIDAREEAHDRVVAFVAQAGYDPEAIRWQNRTDWFRMETIDGKTRHVAFAQGVIRVVKKVVGLHPDLR